MEKENTYPLQLIDDCLREVATTAQQRLLLDWKEQDHLHQQYYEEVERIYQLTKNESTDFEPNVEVAWQSLKYRLDKNLAAPDKQAKIVRLQPWLKLAAVMVVGLGVTFFLMKLWNPDSANMVVKAGAAKQMIYLPDSSQVWLHPYSSVTFATEFKKNREVTLDGEAYFEIRKKNGMPFKVFGRLSVTEVLGTSFLIRAYKSQEEEIEVTTGRVSFGALDNVDVSVILLPGNSATCDKENRIKKQNLDNANSLFWKTEQLSFNNESLTAVAEVLEKSYNTHIEYDRKAMATCRFTGNFKKSSLEEILKVIAITINGKLSKKDNTYTLSGKGCEQN